MVTPANELASIQAEAKIRLPSTTQVISCGCDEGLSFPSRDNRKHNTTQEATYLRKPLQCLHRVQEKARMDISCPMLYTESKIYNSYGQEDEVRALRFGHRCACSWSSKKNMNRRKTLSKIG